MTDAASGDLVEFLSSLLSSPNQEDFDLAVEKLSSLSSADYREVLSSLLADPAAEVALGVARAAGLLGDQQAAGFLVELVREPGKWFSSYERKRIRLAAVTSLGLLKSAIAVGTLIDVLEETRDPELELEIVKALGMIGSPRCVKPLLAVMGARAPIALSAAGALAQIGGDQALEGLIRALKHEDDMVRSASVWALGQMADERAIEPLLELAAESDALLRGDIAWAIGQIGGDRAWFELQKMCVADPDMCVRLEAAKAIRDGAALGKLGRGTEHYFPHGQQEDKESNS